MGLPANASISQGDFRSGLRRLPPPETICRGAGMTPNAAPMIHDPGGRGLNRRCRSVDAVERSYALRAACRIGACADDTLTAVLGERMRRFRRSRPYAAEQPLTRF